MSPRSIRPLAVGLGLALLGAVSWPADARGDGGTLRAWQRRGGYEIAVFTEPTPFVAGPVDISVLLLDTATGEPVPGTDVAVEVDCRGRTMRHPATTDAATNKLLHAAVFNLDASGRCEVNVIVDGPNGPAQLRFDLDVARPSTLRDGIWWWILWPAVVIAVYGVHRRLVETSDRARLRR